MNRTEIEWVVNPDGGRGFTWNPVTGCLNHDSRGNCLGGGFPCYAYRLAHGRLKTKYLMNCHLPLRDAPYRSRQTDPFWPRLWDNRLSQPTYQSKPAGIFVCDMGELFGDWIPREWQQGAFEVIKDCPQHRFYLLTKQPQNLVYWSPFPENCWAGITITDGRTDIGNFFTRSDALVKFISFEPLLHWPMYGYERVAESFRIIGVNWVIIGAQTKPYNPPRLEWVKEIVEAADLTGIAVFLKDNLWPILGDGTSPIPRWAEMECAPNVYALRQEMPQI